MLGNGFYRQTKRLVEGNTKFGDELLLRFELRLGESGRTENIYSDGSEKVIESFIKDDNLFFDCHPERSRRILIYPTKIFYDFCGIYFV